MNIIFGRNILEHKTEFGIGDDAYTRLVCISKNGTTSFIVYWYCKPEDVIVISDLFVSVGYRKLGAASNVIKKLKNYCEENKKTLKLWTSNDGWEKRWYESIGFVCEGKKDDVFSWMKWEPSK